MSFCFSRKVLPKGTQRGYSALDFSQSGDKLASVGQSPDFMLTIWDWAQEKVILHCKAFGQDVAKVLLLANHADPFDGVCPTTGCVPRLLLGHWKRVVTPLFEPDSAL